LTGLTIEKHDFPINQHVISSFMLFNKTEIQLWWAWKLE